jgi:hypothetical protein
LSLLFAAAVLAGCGSEAGGPGAAALPGALQMAPKATAKAGLSDLPLRFEANRGQTDPRVRFLARGPGYTLFLTKREAIFALAGPKRDGGSRESVVRMRFAGADAQPVASGGRRLPGVTNYLRAGQRAVTGVPGYDGVTYRDAYRGIDVEYHARKHALEYDFIVSPRADPDQIALEYRGARSLRIDAGRQLRIATAAGELRQRRPAAHQVVDGRRRSVSVAYKLLDDGRVGLAVGRYDRSKTLVIDPVVTFGTYLGGTGADAVAGIAVDANANAYVTGQTTSANFPTASPLQSATAGATDAFVAKLNAGGTALVYATYLGGSAIDRGRAIAVDSTGAAYVAGDTASTNFPTVNPITATAPAGGNGFVTKLNAAGSALVYSTYLGGAGTDVASAIALGAGGEVHLAGSTTSTDFPTANAVQAATGGAQDAFVSKLNAAGSAFVYSTYLGGSAAEDGLAIAVDAGGAYVAGQTSSTNFPTTAGVFQTALAGGANPDGFVTKLAANGAALAYSTYLGGAGVGGNGQAPTGADSAAGIAVAGGQAYVTGQTNSATFPTTAGALQPSLAGEGDAFVTKLSADAATLTYSTYLGGGSSDQGNAIALQGSSAYVAGSTASGDFPVANAVSVRAGNGDAFLSKLSGGGTALEQSSIIGGSSNESGSAVAADAAGAYLGGSSSLFAQGELPTSGGPQQDNAGAGGSQDGFVVKIADGDPADPLVTRLLPRSGQTIGGSRVSIRGGGFTGATQVRFGDTPATSFTVVSPTRIDATAPASATGVVPVRVTAGGRTSPANPAAGFAYAEGNWEVAGQMNQARFAATMTLLPNGKVLAAGGRASQGGAALSSAELYDPLTRTWTPTGSMSETRFTHTATLLPNGKVLVAGGFNEGLTTNAQPNSRTAELYDPATGTWSSGGTMVVRHALHAAILLRGGACSGASPPAYCGKVLVASGRTCTPQDTPPAAGCNSTFTTNVAELYDPTDGPTGSWTAVAPTTSARTTTDMALLPDGRVLLPAGFPTGQATAEIYDPAAGPLGTWTDTGLLAFGRARGGAIRLLDGRVLVVAGFPNNQTGEVYDPTTQSWGSTHPMRGFGRFDQIQALLPSGKVIVAGGGNGGASVEIYNPATNAWEDGGLLSAGRGSSSSNANSQPAVVLSRSTTSFASNPAVCGSDCGKVLIAGESDDRLTELYGPADPGLLPKPPAAPPPPPAVVPPPPPPPAAALTRRRGTLTASVTPSRDLRAPYRFRTRGTLRLPSAIARSAGCSGRVRVTIKRGRVTISRRTVRLSPTCTYSSRVSFANRRKLGRATRLRFVARFLGNTRVLPANARARYARVRR